MKKTLRIYFVDFWNGFNPEDNFFVDRLRLYYDVDVNSKNPDYLFFSYNGSKHFQFDNCIKIYFSGENDVPDFNICDYAIGFHNIKFDDRYLRFPLFTLYKCFPDLDVKHKVSADEVRNRKFCAFVVSNSKNSDPIRELFFKKLSEYKKVDSGGRYLNNIGKPVENKLDFIKNYKFTIAFENSIVPGYTTEKIVEPLAVNSVPIYWGNQYVSNDFNSKSFINVNDFRTIDEAVKEVIRLDQNDDDYLEMVNQPAFTVNHKNSVLWLGEFDSFLNKIFNKETKEAKRRIDYGYARFYAKRHRVIFEFISLPVVKTIVRKLGYK